MIFKNNFLERKLNMSNNNNQENIRMNDEYIVNDYGGRIYITNLFERFEPSIENGSVVLRRRIIGSREWCVAEKEEFKRCINNGIDYRRNLYDN